MPNIEELKQRQEKIRNFSIIDVYKRQEYARSITLERPALLGRIIARPYVGEPGNFTRTSNRRDCLLYTSRCV